MTFCEQWRISQTVEFVVSNGYRIIALQFPGEYLDNCVLVVDALQQQLVELDHEAKLYVLADSVYDQLSVDAITAAHVEAECIVHYGNASLTGSCPIPTHFVFPSFSVSIPHLLESLSRMESSEMSDKIKLVILLDPSLQKQKEELMSALSTSEVDPIIADLEMDSTELGRSITDEKRRSCCGYSWDSTPDCSYLWIGPLQSEALTQFQLHLASDLWLVFDTDTSELKTGLLPPVKSQLKRRAFLVEKAREAQIIGILISSISDKTTLPTLERLKKLVHEAGKTTYEIVVAQPTPTKLANFREIDVFVYLCDPSAMILDCKEFLAPLITPYEAQMALTGGYLAHQEYRYHLEVYQEDVLAAEDSSLVESSERGLVLRQEMNLASGGLNSGFDASQYFQKRREFHGLEKQTSLEPSEIRQGRTGTASGYEDEMQRNRTNPSGNDVTLTE